jgi:predicted DNA-binding transcriptional regulator YafY
MTPTKLNVRLSTMAKYKPQHARLLFIDRKIREKRFPNCATLAEEWEVSISTIQRDLDYLRYELDAPLEYSAKERGYLYTEEQYQLPAINIKESDLFAIYLADKLLGQYEGTPIYDSLRSVFSKIEDSLPEKVATRPGNDQSLFTVFPPFSTIILPEVFATVLDCLRTSTRLEIEYGSPGNVPARRRIDPYHGVRFEGDWYVVGFCHLRGAIRTFSLARIATARKLQERFVMPGDFDFRKLSGSQFGIHWGEGEVEVKIWFASPAAPYVRERIWHSSQAITDNPDGSLVLSLTVNHLLELQRWILSWGAMAQVLEPQSLVDEVRNTVQSLTKRYPSP